MELELEKETGLPYQVHDLSMRLQGCLVMYDGKPFFIEGVDGNRLVGTLNMTGEHHVVQLPDAKLDVSAKPIGYVNNRRSCFFLSRQPVRRYKQGLHSQNIFTDTPMVKRLSDEAFGRMLLGMYPSFEDCLKSVKREVLSRAFNRRWAVATEDGLVLKYKGETVGWFSFGVPVLSSDFEHLKEDLEYSIERSRV